MKSPREVAREIVERFTGFTFDKNDLADAISAALEAQREAVERKVGLPGVLLDDAAVDAIEARLKATEQRPWFIADGGRLDYCIDAGDADGATILFERQISQGDHAREPKRMLADGEFIVEAHNNDIPALLADRRALLGLIHDLSLDGATEIFQHAYKRGWTDGLMKAANALHSGG